MTFKHDAGATVADAKNFFADSTSAPTEYIKVLREDGLEVINEDTPLRSGEQLTILYTLAGGGSCKCEVKCKCETDFPPLCQLGWCCNHCWVGTCNSQCFRDWFCGAKACCFNRTCAATTTAASTSSGSANVSVSH